MSYKIDKFLLIIFILAAVFGGSIMRMAFNSALYPREVYCPLVDGKPEGQCYATYHVDGNCAQIGGKIKCGEAYLLKIVR